ncbi:MAG: DUF1850 domain-containing protein [Treponema sp.]|nr:DUF1850 domain-containing protein [Treponema sp.]
MNKGRVHDFYRLTSSGELELFMTEFVSYGAGIPEPEESLGARFYSTDTGYVIEDLNRVLPSLLMAVGLVAEHSIGLGKAVMEGMHFSEENEFFLKNFFKPQTSLVFEVQRVSILDYLRTKKVEKMNE